MSTVLEPTIRLIAFQTRAHSHTHTHTENTQTQSMCAHRFNCQLNSILFLFYSFRRIGFKCTLFWNRPRLLLLLIDYAHVSHGNKMMSSCRLFWCKYQHKNIIFYYMNNNNYHIRSILVNVPDARLQGEKNPSKNTEKNKSQTRTAKSIRRNITV